MSKFRIIIYSILALLLAIGLILFDNTKDIYFGARDVYRVYLDGKSLGLVASKKEFEEYIDQRSREIKAEYNVYKVYAPLGIEVKQEITYNEKIETVEDIYRKIPDEGNFTIDGYVIRIVTKEDKETKEDKNEDQVKTKETIINVLDKSIFEESLKEMVYSFVGKERFEDYENHNQIEITETGVIIENIYYDAKIYLKKELIPINQPIYTDIKELTRFLMFGETTKEKIYTVQSGDTVKKIASNSNLNVSEFLIANRNLSGEEALLYSGQKVIVNLINPLFPIVEQDHVVEFQPIKYKTEFIEDATFAQGYSVVTQHGVDGKSLVTNKVKIENGIKVDVLTIDKKTIDEPLNRIVKVGVGSRHGGDYWGWPTRSPYTISDTFGPRWGSWHNGIDISGTGGRGSPIYAANDGVVTHASYTAQLGNSIEINHNNGYSTVYAHLSKMYVGVGSAVSLGQLIGGMGDTGYSFGVHLHFCVKYNGSYIYPFLIYK